MNVTTMSPLDVVRRLGPASGVLLSQLALHEQLVRAEWAQEKRRLVKMLLLTLVVFACLLGLLLLCSTLVVALSWNTEYRTPIMLGLIVIYTLILWIAWRRLCDQAALGKQSFAASREELAADLALLKSCL